MNLDRHTASVTAATALAVLLSACKGGSSAEHAARDSTAQTVEQPAPALRLAQADGGVFDLAQQRGKVIAIFFGYTHCPDFCPTTMADFASVKRRLRDRADSARFVFVTVDPKRDTPERAAAYARGFDRSFIGLSGDSASLAEIQRTFHVASFIEPDSSGGDNYLVGHSALVFVIGKDGRVANTILPGSGRVEWLFNTMTEALDAGATR